MKIVPEIDDTVSDPRNCTVNNE